MHISRTPGKLLLSKRLDPEYYAPQHLADEESLSDLGTISLGSTGKLFVGPFGSKLPTSVFVKEGVPLFRVGNVGEMDVVLKNLAMISPNLHHEIAGSEVVPGDVLIVKASVGEKVCVVPKSIQHANITQHIIGLRPNGTVDQFFIAAVLFSVYGRRQVERRALGAVIQYLGVGDARTVLIPGISPDAQAYIGNKVRQAEALRAAARASEQSFNDEVAVDVSSGVGGGIFNRVHANRIGSDLNPGRYNSDRLRVVDQLIAGGGRRLGSFASISTKTAEPESPSQTYLGLDGISSVNVDLTVSSIQEAEPTGISRQLEAGIAVSKLRPYLNKVALIPSGLDGMLASTELLCIRPKGIHAGFVYGVLKLGTTVRQLNPVATGATHPRVTAADVLDVVVPLHKDHERLGRTLEAAQRAYFAARALTQAARLLVEALIERKITEAELIAAHQRPEADRALLMRLTPDGVDVPGADPLFADLDWLQALLAEAGGGQSDAL